jgi:threonine dehydrogenase-like Zn-dependent dehydrogenase
MQVMRVVSIPTPGQVRVEEQSRPAPSPEDVVIRSRAVGICGSDVELYRGTRPADFCRYPVVPGHEWAGEVAAVGERVRNLLPGTKVVAEGIVSCGACQNCRNGFTNLCEASYDELGFTRPGGMAEYVAVPARLVHPLPEAAPLDEAALLEPTAVVACAFLRASPHPGETVVVIGDGTIGLLAVQLASLFSPAALILLGSHDDRLALGQQFGATHTINTAHDDPGPLLRSLTGGRGADLVFEGGSRPKGVAQAFHLARRGGVVLLEGIAGAGAALQMESDLFVLKHLTVCGIFSANTAAWTYAVALFRAGLLHLAPLITHRFSPDTYQTALDTVTARAPGTLKVLVTHEAPHSE